MGVRSRLIMRCTIQYDATSTENSWNNPDAANWQTFLSDVACWFWVTHKKTALDENRSALVEDARMLIPNGQGINEEHRVTNIVNRLGTVLYAGTYEIQAVEKMPAHSELVLKKVD